MQTLGQPPRPMPLPAASIANVFVSQYYSVRATQPSSLFRFYTNESTTAWPSRLEWTPPPGGAAPLLELHTGQSAINVKALSLGFDQLVSDVQSVDALYSAAGSVLVVVTGCLKSVHNSAEGPRSRAFVQSFVLSPQAGGFFVLTDVLRLARPAGDSPSPSTTDSSPATPVKDADAHKASNGTDDSAAGSPSLSPTSTLPQPIALTRAPPVGMGAQHIAQQYAQHGMMPSVAFNAPYGAALASAQAAAAAAAQRGGGYPGQQQQQHGGYEGWHYGMAPGGGGGGGGGGPRRGSPAPGGAGPHASMGSPVRGGGPTALLAPPVEENASIFVRRLPLDVSDAEVLAAFERFGTVTRVVVKVAPQAPHHAGQAPNQQRAFAFLDFDTCEAAAAALAATVTVGGQLVAVEEKRERLMGMLPSGRGGPRGGPRGRGGPPGGGGGRMMSLPFGYPPTPHGYPHMYGQGQGDMSGAYYMPPVPPASMSINAFAFDEQAVLAQHAHAQAHAQAAVSSQAQSAAKAADVVDAAQDLDRSEWPLPTPVPREAASKGAQEDQQTAAADTKAKPREAGAPKPYAPPSK